MASYHTMASYCSLSEEEQKQYRAKLTSELKPGIRPDCLTHQTGARTPPGKEEWSDKLKTTILMNTPSLDLPPMRKNPRAAADLARFQHHLGNTVSKAEA